MDKNRIVELLRAALKNPFFVSYIRTRDPEPDEASFAESSLSAEQRRILKVLSATQIRTIPPSFKLVFWSVLILTVGSAIGALLIAFFAEEPLQTNQQTMFETLDTVWKMGIGAIFGLIGGKAS